MCPDLGTIARRAPVRVLSAALKDARGIRLGRFSLSERDGSRWHSWEWLDGGWPDGIFYMEPNHTEPSSCDALSKRYALSEHEVEVHSSTRGWDRSKRFYEVLRADDAHRHIATVGVGPSGLWWFEQQHGGVVELCPAWLVFRPCAPPTLDEVNRKRAWRQPLERGRDSLSMAPVVSPTEPGDPTWQRIATIAAWPV